ncbi:MAG: leucyl aminopeptidase family protein, partial [Gammaproteobacteria bacterium]
MSLITEHDGPRTAIQIIQKAELETWRGALAAQGSAWIEKQQFEAKNGQFAWLPDDQGAPDSVVVGWDGDEAFTALGSLPFKLPEGVYELATAVSDQQLLGWGLGAYHFDQFKAAERQPAQLLLPANAAADEIVNQVNAMQLVRDLINLPADELNPSRLAEEAIQLADSF